MNNLWAMLPMQESNNLLADTEQLRARYDEDGYLLLRDVLDPAEVFDVRRDVVEILADVGWLVPGSDPMRAVSTRLPVREGDDEYFEAYDRVQRLESFHTLAHSPALLAVMRSLVGDTAFPHPLKVMRLIFPNHHPASTPPHQDFYNNQGTELLTATWTPLGDCPPELGSVAVLRGSHKYGRFPLAFHLGAGNRQADLPPEVLEHHRWVTAHFRAGDVLVFGSMTVHASLHNSWAREMRLSADFRYQPEHEPLTAMVLEPHFGRESWSEVYRDWQSTEFQYYWRDKHFEVVDFDAGLHDIEEVEEDQYRQLVEYRHHLRGVSRRMAEADR